MARHDNTYSRLVAWAKVLLPLMALAILSILFLVARTLDPEQAIPYSEVEVEEILREQRIERPDYSGMTTDGTAIVLSAESARPNSDEKVTATALRAIIETPDGGRLDLRAGTGDVDTGARIVRMRDGVRIETSSGYVIDTTGVDAALDATDVRTTGAVSAVGPPGRLRAGGMTLVQEASPDNPDYVLNFHDGVKLIYAPQPGQGEL